MRMDKLCLSITEAANRTRRQSTDHLQAAENRELSGVLHRWEDYDFH